MEIINIQECGSSNLLKWAITNGADIKNDVSLQAIVNTELFYQVTLTNVNFLELFRLTQFYREKIHVRDEKRAEVPSLDELEKYFKGVHKIDDQELTNASLVQHACNMFMDLALQMNTDDDIIRHENARMFLPMISRKFEVDIPINFSDLVAAFQTPEDARKLFNSSYPENLVSVVINEEEPMIMNILLLYMMKSTSVVKYDSHYEQLLKIAKYAPLIKCTDDKLYKFRLSGFSKYNNITRGEVKCNMFNVTKPDLESSIKKVKSLKTPLKVDFVVQLPIQYMQTIENTYTAEELPISFEASMSSIIEGGLQYNDFISHSFDEESEEIEKYNNAISLYKTRINEANHTVLNTIPIMLNSEYDIDYTNAFAMLPSIYTTKAIITLNMEYKDRYLGHFDAQIRTMFQEMIEAAESIEL